MRITNKSMNNTMLRNLNQGLGRLDRFQQQLATGKRVLLPSDDPASVTSIMQLKSSLVENEQYIKNVDDAYSWMDSTDTVFDSITNVLHRARELTVYSATDSLSHSDRQTIADEIEQLFGNVLQLANSTHGGKYLFSGQMTTTLPFHRVSTDPSSEDYMQITYQGGYRDYQNPDNPRDLASLNVEIGVGSELAINAINADNRDGEVTEHLFTPVFDILHNLHHSLKTGDTGSLGTSDLAELDVVFDQILSHRSETGAKMNRVELSRERLTDLKLNLSKLLSNARDVDVTEAIMHLKAEENVYRTALSVGARIIQPSLVDFLR